MPDTSREMVIQMGQKAGDMFKTISAIATPLLVLFIGYMQLAEASRAVERWESPAFERRIESLTQITIANLTHDHQGHATRADIARLEKQIQTINEQLRPITSYLIREGIIE